MLVGREPNTPRHISIPRYLPIYLTYLSHTHPLFPLPLDYILVLLLTSY